MYRSYLVISLALFGGLRIGGYFTDPLLSGSAIHQIVGEPARLDRVTGESQELRVVTWNIERGVQFDRILTTLQGLDADIVLLQEVDMFCPRSGWRDVARDLADALGMNWQCAGEFQEIGESRGGVPALTGQAVLSRYSIEEPGVIPFKAQASPFRWRLNPFQPRRGGRIAFRVRTAGIVVYNVHLESGGNEKLRRKQLDEVLADQARNVPDATPVIVAGDFNNEDVIRSSMFSPLSGAAFADALFGDHVHRRTSIRHSHPIDWIFVRNLQPLGGQVAEVDHASDHYPLVATVPRTSWAAAGYRELNGSTGVTSSSSAEAR
ncbi:MAG: endonuclease/exonuclease/phosphatase family protein [Acidobacteria bacterium]|nr:endonuclease/exonuclease/phosphatase family protein [Acidobacteriota bacterium]